ncbi:MAG: hypothetical protein HN509_02955 [Halobacteriovoraceae bacterium]|jgi:hypothetical protein|nr:hypothetical protein [Halobacteriovoraceae bacterium]MBT5093098.1 hypothetical protein [Halobacteriovoraceae bacterium]
MAKINDKNIKKLSDWNEKELRKLKINCNNRASTLKANPKSELKEKHLLYGLEVGQLANLVVEIKRAEKQLAMQ